MGSLIKKYGWREWLCHSNFSFLVGASHPEEYVAQALALRYEGVGITDFDGVYGIVRAYRQLKEWRALGEKRQFNLYYGAEIHLRQDHVKPLYYQDTLALLALSHQGYFNLCRLLSYAHREGKHNGFVPLDYLLSQPVDDVVAVQPMRGALRLSMQNDPALSGRWLALKEHFQGRFYFTVSRLQHPMEDQWIPAVLQLARAYEVPVLLSQDAFFHRPGVKDLSDLLQAIRLNCTMNEALPHLFVNSERTLHPLVDVERFYGALPCYEAALKNSARLAEGFNFDLSELRYHYPKNMIPAGFSSQSYLEKLVWEGARGRYGQQVPDKIKGALQHELKLVAHLQFADYFLTVWDIVRWAREQNILCQGRGSAANSAICYVLGITAIDPDRFELLFERFISVERGDPPDIDVDFEHERREEVIQYIYERYGREQAAMVANVICFKTKGAFRAVGKALGVPEVLINRVSHLLESRNHRQSPARETVAIIKNEMPEGATLPDRTMELWAELTERLRGFPRHLGIHSGGFMLADKPLNHFVPQEPATMPGRTVIQWSKDDIEALGFFKIDVLALGMLTAIRKCLALLHQHESSTMTLASIPAEDPETYKMIQAADTIGVFQIESRAQMSMLPRLKPETFYDLVVEVAIIRPGPIQGGMIHPYLKRRHGLEPVVYPDPRLIPILKRTYGVPIFQEQVMRVAIAVGGFTPGEADELRKNIGSFAMKGNVEVWIHKLADGMRQNGIAEHFVQSILGQMEGFASYGFPESHSASFALLAYASAYLKRHHPAAFFASILNSLPMGFYSPDTLVKAAQRDQVKVFPICAQSSEWDHTLERGGIRLGLRLVRGLSQTGAKRMLEQRAKVGRWDKLEDFLKECRLSRIDLTALAAARGLESWGIPRRAAIWLAEAAPFNTWLREDVDRPAFEAETQWEEVQTDYHASHTSLGPHPTLLMKKEAWCFEPSVQRLVTAKRLREILPHTMVHVFGMVLVRQAPPTAKGMMFITLEDEEGSLNLVVRPNIYRQFHRLIDGQAFLCVAGKLEKAEGVFNIMVHKVFEPTIAKAEVIEFPSQEKARFIPQELFPARNYT